MADAPIRVRIVAGRQELETALRELAQGSTVEVAVGWIQGGGDGPRPELPSRQGQERYARRLPVPDPAGRRVRYLQVEAIAWIEAESQYVRLHTRDKSFLVRSPAMTISRLASRLDPERFVRVSRSHIVNLDWVVALRTDAPSKRYAVLTGGHEIAVSQAHWERLKEALAGGGWE
jgi:DNA-binding LytR/AlgR family response regulator